MDHVQMLHHLLCGRVKNPLLMDLLKDIVERHEDAQAVIEGYAAGNSELDAEQRKALVQDLICLKVVEPEEDEPPSAPSGIKATSTTTSAETADSGSAAAAADITASQAGASTGASGAAVGATTAAKALEPTVAGAKSAGDPLAAAIPEENMQHVVFRNPRKAMWMMVILGTIMFCCLTTRNILDRWYKEQPGMVLGMLATFFDNTARIVQTTLAIFMWELWLRPQMNGS